MKNFYSIATDYGMICRCATIKHNAKTNKKSYEFMDSLYQNKNKSKEIQYESDYNSNMNCVQVLMGRLHGGYIGIDIIGTTSHAIKTYKKIISDAGETNSTLSRNTPNDGRHYIYKLTDK